MPHSLIAYGIRDIDSHLPAKLKTIYLPGPVAVDDYIDMGQGTLLAVCNIYDSVVLGTRDKAVSANSATLEVRSVSHPFFKPQPKRQVLSPHPDGKKIQPIIHIVDRVSRCVVASYRKTGMLLLQANQRLVINDANSGKEYSCLIKKIVWPFNEKPQAQPEIYVIAQISENAYVTVTKNRAVQIPRAPFKQIHPTNISSDAQPVAARPPAVLPRAINDEHTYATIEETYSDWGQESDEMHYRSLSSSTTSSSSISSPTSSIGPATPSNIQWLQAILSAALYGGGLTPEAARTLVMHNAENLVHLRALIDKLLLQCKPSVPLTASRAN